MTSNERLLSWLDTIIGCAEALNSATGHPDVVLTNTRMREEFAKRLSVETPCSDLGWEMRNGHLTCKGCGRTASDVFKPEKPSAGLGDQVEEIAEEAPNTIAVKCTACQFAGVASKWGGECPICHAKLIPSETRPCEP